MESQLNNIRIISLALLLTALSSCGKGGSKDLVNDVSITTAGYQILDLNTGALTQLNEISDLTTNDDYRTTKMVFRKLVTNTATIGSRVTSFGYESDEHWSHPTVNKYYIGVFEVTQKQWELIAGTTPWTSINPSSAAGDQATGDTKPAMALSFNEINDKLADASSSLGHTLQLPTDNQWEYACRAGKSTIYSWGNAHTPAAASAYAVVWETADVVVGPHAAGSKTANDFGLYDMHGNLWEWTYISSTSGNLRGGSWQSSLPSARAANFLTPALDIATEHALVGARLVLIP